MNGLRQRSQVSFGNCSFYVNIGSGVHDMCTKHVGGVQPHRAAGPQH